ncbi:spore photoproduct lyase family protein [Microvirga sesbaniae]|uniref:spore photoproduct lyase family protein n=1 Tax=Microvirga sesbaniae TaxID=681392 RepID=UPI0021C600C0|nr:hypothetical protein [Microvirga sp. HBU67692]
MPRADLTVALIMHRFTAGSKEMLARWHPGSSLDMDEASRAQKHMKFGSFKDVCQPELMERMRDFFMAGLVPAIPMR